MFFNTSENPGVGPSIRNIEFNIYNRSATTVAVGDVLMLDHLFADGASFDNLVPTTAAIARGHINVDGGPADAEADTWAWGNGLVPTGAGAGLATASAGAGTGGGGAPLVVVTSLLNGAGADNTIVRVCIDGIVEVSCLNGEPVVPGDTLTADAAKTLTSVAAVGKRAVGKSLSIKADTTDGNVLAYFCGWSMLSQNFAN